MAKQNVSSNAEPAVNLGNRRVRRAPGSETIADTGAADGTNAAALQNARDRRAATLAERARNGAANGNAPRKFTRMQPDDGGAELGELEQRQPRTTQDKVAAIGELLRNGLSDDDGDGGELDNGDEGAPNGDGQETGDNAPLTVDAIAEALGVDTADLWETAEFVDSKGKVHKLGELKDVLQAGIDLEGQELAFSERKAAEENEMLKQRQELDFIVRSLPTKAITPELKARATAERERVLKLELERTVAAIPEWANAEKRKSEKAEIGKWMAQYGFAGTSIDGTYDHRMLKLLRDSWVRYERVQKALAKVKEDKGEGAGKPARSRGAAPRRAQMPGPNASRQDKVAAVASLLRGGK